MKSQNPASEPPQKIKVLIVDDHPMFREQLAQLINREFGLEVCGEADIKPCNIEGTFCV
jgi:response regulator RpfG family c-di-GMP phosphodiesterase